MDCQAIMAEPMWMGQLVVALRHSASSDFPFGLSGIIQIEFRSLEICQNSNKFDKNMKSTLLFEFKYNI
jgi:hypothetical protein